MSDEEDGPDYTFVMKTLEWRAHHLTGLIRSLDDRLDRARNKNIVGRKGFMDPLPRDVHPKSCMEGLSSWIRMTLIMMT